MGKKDSRSRAQKRKAKLSKRSIRSRPNLAPADGGNPLLPALAHHRAGRLAEAEQICRQVLRNDPNESDASNLLGVISRQLGKHEVAARLFRKAVSQNGKVAMYHNNLGNSLKDLGKLQEAVTAYDRALALEPHIAQAHNNRGTALMELGELDEAMDCYERALALEPNYAEAHSNLGNLLKDRLKLKEAEDCLQRALALDPNYVDAHYNLGYVLMYQSRMEESASCFERVLELRPNFPKAHSNLLMAMNYLSRVSPKELYERSLQWNERHCSNVIRMPSPRNDPDPQRRLRIGYLSADLKSHPVGIFLEGILCAHDRSQIEVFCYANMSSEDDLTTRLRESADCWHTVVDRSDEEVSELIRQDGIDILVDLSGHTSDNRLLVFAHKPAPVQATWLGYFFTTGLKTIDYIIADRFAIPPEEERFYSEKVIRLPASYIYFTPPKFSIQIGELAALSVGRVTFGCFNNLIKVTPEVIGLWSEILHAVPESVLFLKAKVLADPNVCSGYHEMFEANGIGPQRLRFEGGGSRPELIAAYGQVDIGLDPFPFNGGITTAEALWMGVPVITLRGDRFAGHVGESLLNTVALDDLIAGSQEEYLAKAVELSGDFARLSQLHDRLRQRLLDSPLCNAENFTRGLESAYRQMWRTWCEKKDEG